MIRNKYQLIDLYKQFLLEYGISAGLCTVIDDSILMLLELQYEVDKLHCAVPSFIFNRLQVHSDFNIGKDRDTNAAYLNYQDKIIIYKDTMLFPTCLIETIKCWSLKHLIVFKEVRGTEKDIEDITKIKTWMQLNSIMQVSYEPPKPPIVSIS